MRPRQRFFEASASPLLVVPGNHDIPYTFPARFTRTYDEFERQWETTEPVYRSDRILAVGLNSVRPWRNQGGGVHQSQLARAAEVLRASTARNFESPCCTTIARSAVALAQEAGRPTATVCSGPRRRGR